MSDFCDIDVNVLGAVSSLSLLSDTFPQAVDLRLNTIALRHLSRGKMNAYGPRRRFMRLLASRLSVVVCATMSVFDPV